MNGEPVARPASDAPNVYAALATLARRSSDGALASAAATGLFGVAALLFAPAEWRLFTLLLVAVGAFGLWGMIERDRSTSTGDEPAPRPARSLPTVVQGVAVVVGTVAAVIVALALVGALVGRVIS